MTSFVWIDTTRRLWYVEGYTPMKPPAGAPRTMTLMIDLPAETERQLLARAAATGPAFACFRLVEGGQVTLCVSVETLAEAQDVLTRPALQAKFPCLTPERVEVFLKNVAAKAVLIATVPKVLSYPRDPDDEPY